MNKMEHPVKSEHPGLGLMKDKEHPFKTEHPGQGQVNAKVPSQVTEKISDQSLNKADDIVFLADTVVMKQSDNLFTAVGVKGADTEYRNILAGGSMPMNLTMAFP